MWNCLFVLIKLHKIFVKILPGKVNDTNNSFSIIKFIAIKNNLLCTLKLNLRYFVRNIYSLDKII